jgi:hypothetical protein
MDSEGSKHREKDLHMRLFSQWKTATNLACMILMALGTTYAATSPVQITINGSDLTAGQLARNPLFDSGMTGIQFRPGAPRPASTFAPTIPTVPFGFYPADLQNPNNNPTVGNVTVHNIFVNPFQPAPGVYSQGAAGSPTIGELNRVAVKEASNHFGDACT